MKKTKAEKCFPYNINIREEARIYKNVGHEKENEGKALKVYDEWHKYISGKFDNLKGSQNAYRYLVREKRYLLIRKEICYGLTIPALIAYVTAWKEFVPKTINNSWRLVGFVLLLIAMILLVIKNVFELYNQINFINDFSEIIFESDDSGI